jgi:hypothetical protein
MANSGSPICSPGLGEFSFGEIIPGTGQKWGINALAFQHVTLSIFWQ